jgi:Flp pilus assembly protein TadD
MHRLYVLLILFAAPALQGSGFDLDTGAMKSSLGNLAASERGTIDRALGLIKKGQHTAAFAQLSELSRNNPNNSAARVVLAYALLQAGNLAGAFEHAQQAEAAADHNSYVCLFLARIAYIAGDRAICEREIKHVKKSKTYRTEVAQIERDLKRISPASWQR